MRKSFSVQWTHASGISFSGYDILHATRRLIVRLYILPRVESFFESACSNCFQRLGKYFFSGCTFETRRRLFCFGAVVAFRFRFFTGMCCDAQHNMNTTIAILIDGENCSPSVVPWVFERARTHGRILIANVYGDFSKPNMHCWRQVCIEYNVEPVMVWSIAQKNSADMRCCRDACSYIHSQPISIYILVTGDSDFTTIVTALKRANKYVIGAHQGESTASALQIACDEYWFPVSSDTVERKESTLLEAVRAELDNLFDSDGEALRLSQVKEHLIKVNPAFVQTNFGFKKFGDFIQHVGYKVVTKNTTAYASKETVVGW